MVEAHYHVELDGDGEVFTGESTSLEEHFKSFVQALKNDGHTVTRQDVRVVKTIEE